MDKSKMTKSSREIMNMLPQKGVSLYETIEKIDYIDFIWCDCKYYKEENRIEWYYAAAKEYYGNKYINYRIIINIVFKTEEKDFDLTLYNISKYKEEEHTEEEIEEFENKYIRYFYIIIQQYDGTKILID